jgi:hypothetical protein
MYARVSTANNGQSPEMQLRGKPDVWPFKPGVPRTNHNQTVRALPTQYPINLMYIGSASEEYCL